MRKLTALVFAVALVFAMAGTADAQRTYTWETVRSTGAHLIWINQANSPNIFEADLGLLGRVITAGPSTGPITPVLDPNQPNACELAPSFPCAAGSPPAFLGIIAEGPIDTGANAECNRAVISCTVLPANLPIPIGGHDGDASHLAGLGSYSYIVIHTPSEGTSPSGKGIGFFTGSYTVEQQPYACNDCPAGGFGKDINDQIALNNTGAGAQVTSLDVTLWLTQSTAPFGHALVSLAPGGAGAGKVSTCGTGLNFQNLHTDLCVDGLNPGVGNFTIPDQKVVVRTYPVTAVDQGELGQGCNAPNCYLERVIIPAALVQNPATTNIQTQTATTILPDDAPGTLANATVDSYLVFLTTELLDIDGDGQEDNIDPCPNDPTNFCISDLIGGGVCPTAGDVFCTDSAGVAGCRTPQTCWSRRDTNQSCQLDATDVNDIFLSQLLNVPLPIGPFGP